MGKFSKRIAAALGIGFLTGVLWLVSIRFVTYRPEIVHYHANFALYIDGVRETFDNFTFYEEVASCSSDEIDNPKVRAHMHDNVNDIVHVHDNGVTWGHFFANLGYTLGNSLIKTENNIYTDGNGGQLRFILNGQETRSVANQVIKSEDVLLIDYGNDNREVLTQRYESIGKNAAEFNEQPDPSACSGSEDLTFGGRLKKSFGIN